MAMDYTPEVADGGVTWYTPIDAPDGRARDSATFIPDGVHAASSIDLILYFHGKTSRHTDIRSYINDPDIRPLRSAVAADGRFALVMPWLGQQAAGQHIVQNAEAFDLYLGSVIAGLRAQATPDPAPSIGAPNLRLVLAAHSGGGNEMSQAVGLRSTWLDRVAAVWAFDCFYENYLANWVGFLKAHGAVSFDCLWTPPFDYQTREGKTVHVQGTRDNSQAIAARFPGTPRVRVGRSAVGHNHVPKHYLPRLLQALP